MRIGELSRQTGASVRSLRYYEHRELLIAQRSPGGQRLYDPSAVERVRLIRQLLSAGLTTNVIADVLPCMSNPGTQTTELTARLMNERDRLDDEIAERNLTRAALQGLIDAAPPVTS